MVEKMDMGFRVAKRRMPEEDGDERLDLISQIHAPGIGLYDYLTFQLETTPVSEPLRREAIRLAGFLDENGYLSGQPKPTLSDDGGRLFEKALALLQSMEPAGVAARDLRECILLQLKRRGIYGDPVETLVKKSWK